MSSKLLVLPALMLGVAVGLVGGWKAGSRSRPAESRKHIVEGPALIKQVQSLADLVTVKYVVQKVIEVQDDRWYGDNKVLLVAHGIVKAGIDLSHFNDLRVENGLVRVKLPQPKVTDSYLDDSRTEVVEHRTGLLRGYDKDLEQEARRKALEDIERTARTQGICDEAANKARAEIERTLRQMGFAKVEFI